VPPDELTFLEFKGWQAEMCGRLENTLAKADFQSLFNVTALFDLESKGRLILRLEEEDGEWACSNGEYEAGNEQETKLATSMISSSVAFFKGLVDGLFCLLGHNCGTFGFLGQNEGTQLLEFASLRFFGGGDRRT
jgi:hypothetical protein